MQNFFRLLLALIMLEHQCNYYKNESAQVSQVPPPTTSPTRAEDLSNNALKFIPGALIPQQPMFIASILNALKLVRFIDIFEFDCYQRKFVIYIASVI